MYAKGFARDFSCWLSQVPVGISWPRQTFIFTYFCIDSFWIINGKINIHQFKTSFLSYYLINIFHLFYMLVRFPSLFYVYSFLGHIPSIPLPLAIYSSSISIPKGQAFHVLDQVWHIKLRHWPRPYSCIKGGWGNPAWRTSSQKPAKQQRQVLISLLGALQTDQAT